MRPSAAGLANLLAWTVFAGPIAAALLVADRLGFVGLVLLGAITWLVCSRAALNDPTPTWGVEVFRAGLHRAGSPERRAALEEERQRTLSPLRFYGRCGMALVVIGVAGLVWHGW